MVSGIIKNCAINHASHVRLHGSGGIWYNTRHMNKFAISFDLIITLGGCRSAEEVVV